jgi:hypothetical protein
VAHVGVHLGRPSIELVGTVERDGRNEIVDDIIIAFGLTGWKLVGPDGARWPMVERTVHVPPWAISVAEQDRDARRGAAIAVASDRHSPRPRASQMRCL